MKKEIIFLKLGGSLITDKSKPFTLRQDILKRICKEIHEARTERKIPLIIGHGGGSFPHTSAARYQTQKGYINKESKSGFCNVQNDASKLNRIVIQNLLYNGENAVSVQPSASCVMQKGKIESWFMKPIKILLKDDYIPVVFGDVVLDKKQGCSIASTEEIFSFLAKKLGGKKIILAGKVDGVLYSNGKIIEEITSENFGEIKKYLHGSDGTDVTGGMVLKVGMMLELAKKGIVSIIINGLKEGNIKKALLGNAIKGTVIRK